MDFPAEHGPPATTGLPWPYPPPSKGRKSTEKEVGFYGGPRHNARRRRDWPPPPPRGKSGKGEKTQYRTNGELLEDPRARALLHRAGVLDIWERSVAEHGTWRPIDRTVHETYVTIDGYHGYYRWHAANDRYEWVHLTD